MDLMGTDLGTAVKIVQTEIASHKAHRFHLTLKLRVYNKLEADSQQREAMAKELILTEDAIELFEQELQTLEGMIAEYEREISELTGELS